MPPIGHKILREHETYQSQGQGHFVGRWGEIPWCGGEDNGPRDARVHVLIPRICKHIALQGKGDFADVLRLRVFRWRNHLRLSRAFQSNLKAGGSESQKAM